MFRIVSLIYASLLLFYIFFYINILCAFTIHGLSFVCFYNFYPSDSWSQALSYLASVGAKTQQVNLKLMQYSLELWSAKIAVGAGTKFACFMAGGEHSGQKVNCFIEIFK